MTNQQRSYGMKDFVPIKKWSIRQNICYWFFKNGHDKTYQRLIIPMHIFKGLYYGYRPKDIFEFCACSWSGSTYLFSKKRPDLRRWHRLTIKKTKGFTE